MHFPNIPQLLISIPPLLFALTLHEYAHGFVAYKLGDPTAKNAGRLSLNPITHLDPFGTFALMFAGFGWAKPVPVNPRYFKLPLKGMLWVALAGPVTNFVLAVISALLLFKIFPIFGNTLPKDIIQPAALMLSISIKMNIVLCVFNFLPIPPLDGSRIISGLLPTEMAVQYMKLEQFGFIILIILLVTGLLSKILEPMYFIAFELLGKII